MIHKGSHKSEKYFGTQHRFEHWYCDKMVYFIAARCRNQTHAFASESCKSIFWNRFGHCSQKYRFVALVTSRFSILMVSSRDSCPRSRAAKVRQPQQR
jgi:hypothetical protein